MTFIKFLSLNQEMKKHGGKRRKIGWYYESSPSHVETIISVIHYLVSADLKIKRS